MNAIGIVVISFIWAVSLLAAVLGGIMISRERMAKNWTKDGYLYITPDDPEVNGGVYVAFESDPKKFRNGKMAMLEVRLVQDTRQTATDVRK